VKLQSQKMGQRTVRGAAKEQIHIAQSSALHKVAVPHEEITMDALCSKHKHKKGKS
jgi:hypothetical protein